MVGSKAKNLGGSKGINVYLFVVVIRFVCKVVESCFYFFKLVRYLYL